MNNTDYIIREAPCGELWVYPGNTSGCITVYIIDDDIPEEPEYFKFNITSSSGAVLSEDTWETVMILDDDNGTIPWPNGI